MRDFFGTVKFRVLVVVAIVLTAIMIQAALSGGFASFPSKLLGVITTPFQKISSSISDNSGNFFTKFFSASKIDTENKKLKEQLNSLRKQLLDYEKIKAENEQYKKFLEIKEQNPDFIFQPASVIGRDPTDRFYTFTIDKGTLHGIKPKDPVITDNGLVGYILEAGPTYSRVTTILNVSSNVGALDQRTRDTGVLTGELTLSEKGLCKLSYLQRESGVANGDLIVTTGIGGVFPKGLIVGTVESVKPEPHGISLYAVIKPTSDIKRIKDVFVITSFLGQSE